MAVLRFMGRIVGGETDAQSPCGMCKVFAAAPLTSSGRAVTRWCQCGLLWQIDERDRGPARFDPVDGRLRYLDDEKPRYPPCSSGSVEIAQLVVEHLVWDVVVPGAATWAWSRVRASRKRSKVPWLPVSRAVDAALVRVCNHAPFFSRDMLVATRVHSPGDGSRVVHVVSDGFEWEVKVFHRRGAIYEAAITSEPAWVPKRVSGGATPG